MRKHPDKDLDEIEIMEDFEEDPDYAYDESDSGRNRARYNSGSAAKLPLFLGIALGIVVVILILLFRGGEGISQDELKALNSKLERMETKIARIDVVEKRITLLEKETARVAADVESDSKVLGKLKKSLDSLERKAAASPAKKTPAASPAAKKTVSPKTLYYVVKKGDTLYGISRNLGVSLKELCSINGLNAKAGIKPGQRLRLSK